LIAAVIPVMAPLMAKPEYAVTYRLPSLDEILNEVDEDSSYQLFTTRIVHLLNITAVSLKNTAFGRGRIYFKPHAKNFCAVVHKDF